MFMDETEFRSEHRMYDCFMFWLHKLVEQEKLLAKYSYYTTQKYYQSAALSHLDLTYIKLNKIFITSYEISEQHEILA